MKTKSSTIISTSKKSYRTYKRVNGVYYNYAPQLGF